MRRRDTKRGWPDLLVLVVLALGALAVAGCGGGSSGSGSTAESTSSSSNPEASGSEGRDGAPGGFDISEEQRSCLKEKGVELPEFKGGPGGGPPAGGEGGGEGREKFKEQSKAFEECGIELPEFKGGPGGKPNMNSAAFRKQVKEYAACVRENGYELAEPNFSGEGPIFEKSESESAAFKKASAQCQDLLGGPGGSEGAEGE